jgi:hypothetical protein
MWTNSDVGCAGARSMPTTGRSGSASPNRFSTARDRTVFPAHGSATKAPARTEEREPRDGAGTTQKAGIPAERGLRRPWIPQTPLCPVRRRHALRVHRTESRDRGDQTAPDRVPAGRTPLELSAEKTLITHARTGAAKFLGYEITTQHSGTSGRKRVTWVSPRSMALLRYLREQGSRRCRRRLPRRARWRSC